MEDEDFLAAVEADNTDTPIEEPKEPETPEPEAAEPAPEPLETPTVEAKPDPGFVPISVVLDEREKRQKLEQELAQFRAAQQQPEPTPLPNVFEDPEGYTQALSQSFEQRLYQQSLQMSERFARNQFGDETTDAALKWAYARCDTDPFFNAQVRSSGDPVGHVVREYQRDQIVQSVTPSDFAEFQAWKTAQAQLQAPAAPAAPPQSPSRTFPPRSLASAPSAGGVMTEVEQSDEEVFDEVMSKR